MSIFTLMSINPLHCYGTLAVVVMGLKSGGPGMGRGADIGVGEC